MKLHLFYSLLVGSLVFQAAAHAYETELSNYRQSRYNTGAGKIAQRGSYGNGFRGRSGRSRNRTSLKVGQVAPDFKLPTKDGKYQVQLSSYKSKKPVVLIFGSYT